MLQVGCLASECRTLYNALPLRFHPKTPLDCWHEVDAFKSAVATEEQVSSGYFFGWCNGEHRLSHALQKYVSSLR